MVYAVFYLPKPKQSSMEKKRTEKKGAPGISLIADVNTMNARPVPSDF